MPTAGGPNTLGESNLVFAYDTGDVKNSYKGQPTVNAFGTYPNYPTDLYNWAYSGNACILTQDTISSPVGNTPLKMVTTGNDAYTNTYNSPGNNISAASSGQTWTISVWAKANQNTVGQIFHFGANSSGNIIDFNATGISLTTEWTRYTYTRTFTDGNVVAIQARLDGPDTFQSGVVVWWDGLQVEQKAYATQFVDGTRSATQGLLPLIGNSTIDLTNVSFDSNAKMVFDGTNDYIYSSVTLGTEITLEIVIQSSNYSGNKIPISINGDAYSSGPNLYFTNNIIAWNTGNGDANPFSNSYYPNSNYHHIVVTNVFGGTAILYIDGIQIGTATSLNTTTTGANKLIIGDYHDGGYAISANIPITKLYNRALTAQEVKQNYQQYKTRFNLS